MQRVLDRRRCGQRDAVTHDVTGLRVLRPVGLHIAVAERSSMPVQQDQVCGEVDPRASCSPSAPPDAVLDRPVEAALTRAHRSAQRTAAFVAGVDDADDFGRRAGALHDVPPKINRVQRPHFGNAAAVSYST